MADITPRINFTRELAGLFDLKGKTAYVPGGYGGIGEAIAWALAMAGARGGGVGPRLRQGRGAG